MVNGMQMAIRTAGYIARSDMGNSSGKTSVYESGYGIPPGDRRFYCSTFW